MAWFLPWFKRKTETDMTNDPTPFLQPASPPSDAAQPVEAVTSADAPPASAPPAAPPPAPAPAPAPAPPQPEPAPVSVAPATVTETSSVETTVEVEEQVTEASPTMSAEFDLDAILREADAAMAADAEAEKSEAAFRGEQEGVVIQWQQYAEGLKSDNDRLRSQRDAALAVVGKLTAYLNSKRSA